MSERGGSDPASSRWCEHDRDSFAHAVAIAIAVHDDDGTTLGVLVPPTSRRLGASRHGARTLCRRFASRSRAFFRVSLFDPPGTCAALPDITSERTRSRATFERSLPSHSHHPIPSHPERAPLVSRREGRGFFGTTSASCRSELAAELTPGPTLVFVSSSRRRSRRRPRQRSRRRSRR